MEEKEIKIVVGVLGMVHEGMEKKLKELAIKGRIKAIQTTVLLESARILRRILDI